MTEPNTATFLIDEKLYLEFCALTFRGLVRRCMRWMLPAVVIAILVFFTSTPLANFSMPVVVGVLAGGLVLGFQRLLTPSRAARIYRETAALKTPHTLTVTDEGFVLELDAGVWRSNWHEMVKWDETNTFFAIYPNRITANIIPKDQVGSGIINTIRENMISSGLSNPGKLRK